MTTNNCVFYVGNFSSASVLEAAHGAEITLQQIGPQSFLTWNIIVEFSWGII
jgi:hypothetical protein